MGQRNQTVYDSLGQIVSETDFNDDTINYAYDGLGRLYEKTFEDPRIASVSYTYNPVTSQLQTVTDGRGVTQYAYDNRDRLQTTTTPDGKTVGYGYDLLSNITSLTTEAGTTSYGYDKLNRLDTVKEGNRTLADYDYDKVGNLSQTTWANGSVESRGYDVRNRLTDLTTKNSFGIRQIGEAASPQHPAIVSVELGKHIAPPDGWHAIVVDGITVTDDGIQVISIRDPAGGEYLYPLEVFKYYFPDGEGAAVFTNPNPNADWLENIFNR